MVDKAEPRALRVVIAGGGTGGHLYPGIAVARELASRQPDAEISFAGTARGIEARVVPHEGFVLDVIRSAGVKGKSMADRARGGAQVVPSLVAAWRGVPTIVLEQNAVPGLTNRILARFVRAAAVTFESTTAFFGDKAFVSGNPVRPEFLQPAESQMESGADGNPLVRVLVFGGSQGAHAINVAMVEAAKELAAGAPHLRLEHQTGERDVAMVRAKYRQDGLAADVAPFFDDMARRIRRADLIVCRAGATTIAEVTAGGRPSILVPLPTATDDHQRKNAEVLVAAGAAQLMPQSEMTGRVLGQRILALAGDADRRRQMAAAARALARPHAARIIVDRVLELAGR